MFESMAHEFQARVMEVMFTNKLPTGTDAIDSGLRALHHIIAHYVEGNTELGKALDGLLEALVNPDDPHVSELSGVERAGLFAVVNQLRQMKASRHAHQDQKQQGEEITAPGR
jgi:hypothetical protein